MRSFSAPVHSSRRRAAASGLRGRGGLAIVLTASLCGLASCSTGGVTGLGPDTATLAGVLPATDKTFSYFFQYAASPGALDTEKALVTTARVAGPLLEETSVAMPIGGLSPATTYRYRLCGSNVEHPGPVCLNTRSFSTAPSEHAGVAVAVPGAKIVDVPSGVTRVHLDVLGAQGGAGFDPGSTQTPTDGLVVADVSGGRGGRVQATVPVAPGDRLIVRVGSAGQDAPSQADTFRAGLKQFLLIGTGGAGGSNGRDHGGDAGSGGGGYRGSGGAGGGAPTRVELIPRDGGTPRTLVVAGGGGGAGGGTLLSRERDPITPGGAAGQLGVSGTAGRPGGAGQGAMSSVGGDGGEPGGEPGVAGEGGAGGTDTTLLIDGAAIAVGRGGGGGGGGWFGGGGGASGELRSDATGQLTEYAASGGGGGSSLVPASTDEPVYTTGTQIGDGSASVTWRPTLQAR